MPLWAKKQGVPPNKTSFLAVYPRGAKNALQWSAYPPLAITEAIFRFHEGRQPKSVFYKKEHPARMVSDRLPSNFLTPPHRAKREGLKKRLGTLSGYQFSHYKMHPERVYSRKTDKTAPQCRCVRRKAPQTALTTGLEANRASIGPNRPFFIDWRPWLRVQLYKII